MTERPNSAFVRDAYRSTLRRASLRRGTTRTLGVMSELQSTGMHR